MKKHFQELCEPAKCQQTLLVNREDSHVLESCSDAEVICSQANQTAFIQMLQICQKRYHVKHDNIQSELVACAACHSTAKETLMTEVNNHPVKNKGSWSGSC